MKTNKLLLFLITASPALSATISINFTDNGSADSTMLTTDVAGLAGASTQVSNWNNAHVNGTTGSLGGLVDETGSATGASMAWASDLGQWRLGHSVSNGHDRMWKGYLDVQSSATVTVSGLPFVGTYDVYVYFDGDNGTSWRVANFAKVPTGASLERRTKTKFTTFRLPAGQGIKSGQ
jgi:hypothetical protein